jgi:putative peptide maturation system protein
VLTVARPAIDSGHAGAPSAALLTDVVAMLSAAQRERLAPAAAQHALSELRARYADWALELVWERESYTGEYHYDVLVRCDGETISLSCCVDGGFPWPMRGVQRWTESIVARVNGAALDVGAAFTTLDFWWSELQLGRRLVQRSIIESAGPGGSLEVGEAELDEAMQRFRRRRGLFSVEQTHAWLEQHGMTQSQLEDHLASEARGERLRAQIAAASADGPPAAYFERHRADFETLRIARVHLTERVDAERLVDRARVEPGSLASLAQQRFAGTGDGELRLVAVRAGDVHAAHRALLEASVGDVLDPLPAGDGWDVVQLLARAPARYGPEVEDLIAQRLFDRWLDRETAQARVEWFWGAAEPSSP